MRRAVARSGAETTVSTTARRGEASRGARQGRRGQGKEPSGTGTTPRGGPLPQGVASVRASSPRAPFPFGGGGGSSGRNTHLLELADVAVLLHDLEELDDDLGRGPVQRKRREQGHRPPPLMALCQTYRMRTWRFPRFSALVIERRASARTDMRTMVTRRVSGVTKQKEAPVHRRPTPISLFFLTDRFLLPRGFFSGANAFFGARAGRGGGGET